MKQHSQDTFQVLLFSREFFKFCNYQKWCFFPPQHQQQYKEQQHEIFPDLIKPWNQISVLFSFFPKHVIVIRKNWTRKITFFSDTTWMIGIFRIELFVSMFLFCFPQGNLIVLTSEWIKRRIREHIGDTFLVCIFVLSLIYERYDFFLISSLMLNLNFQAALFRWPFSEVLHVDHIIHKKHKL